MHQPIPWLEWGSEAFDRAKQENKPILLDIGAVWCHWCHVMDRESYESPEIAAIVTELFIPIKVDRDERPDVDSRFQSAIGAISGQGGWPLTAFLTPEGKPFYGGTYFPPDDLMGRPSFRRVLLAVADAFRERRNDVEREAGSLFEALSQTEGLEGFAGKTSKQTIEKIVQSGLTLFDPVNGGFGTAPKFPHPAAIDVLIDRYSRKPDEQTLSVVTTTLAKMARGGIYDQLAGGFHRYSVDDHWGVPHFEKMSYDNSELLKTYTYAWSATGNRFFAHIARDIIRWMSEWLSDRDNGGFYASQDADVGFDDDGDHFTWTLSEAQDILTAEEFQIAALHYDIEEMGEMHHNPHKNVLWVRAASDEIASRLGRSRDEVDNLIQSAKNKMYRTRLSRPIPYIDQTIYTGWNALCISAFLQASRALGNAELGIADSTMHDARNFALRSLDRLLSAAFDAENGVKHVVSYSGASGNANGIAGVLDDYAFATLACLDAYESTTDITYFRFGQQIGDAMISRFYDKAAGAFFDTDQKASAIGALSARRKPFQDAPTPAGNPSAAIALLRLYSLTHDSRYFEFARTTLDFFAGASERFGIYAGTYGIASIWLTAPSLQVIIVGQGESAAALLSAASRPFALNKSVLHISQDAPAATNLPPALAEMAPLHSGMREGTSLAVVCSNFSCHPPITNPDELEQVIRQLIRSN